MKRILSLVLVIVMAAAVLAGCSAPDDGSSDQAAVSLDSLKTMGDLEGLDDSNSQSSVYEDCIVYAFKLGDKYYRAKSTLDKKTSEAVWALDYGDDDYEEKLNELYSSIPIEEMEDLTDQMLTNEELAALTGKTGQDLLNDGWYINGYNLEDMEFWMCKGPFMYKVAFNGQVPESEYETFNGEEGIKELTVNSAEFFSLGEATNLDLES